MNNLSTVLLSSDFFKLFPVLSFLIGIPPTQASRSSSNAGAIAGGVIVVIIALAAVGVAVVAFLFWFK